MNLFHFFKKLVRYIFCALKYAVAYFVSMFVKGSLKYRDLWIISERGIDARDNSYYLFKYVTQNHPEINIAFVISKTSPDRERVVNLGRVINYGSFEHFIALITSKVKISTHIMGYTPYIDFFVRADKIGLVKGKKIFLQHGIIKDNLTYLYNDNVNIDLFVCSALPEYEYVRDNFGYADNVVRMLGLCRYDDLHKPENKSKTVLVMPTWRYNLGNADRKVFLESEYYRVFSHLLASEKLKDILKKYDYELLFYPHIEMQKFVGCFKDADRIHIKSFKDVTVQELLINSDILITDFSSVFFDYGYMEKPMIFYQFDEDDFRKQHYSEGYFSYKDNAFGKVVYDESALLEELDRTLKNGANIDDIYLDRINKFFTIRDTKNCERNFNAIKEIYDRG